MKTRNGFALVLVLVLLAFLVLLVVSLASVVKISAQTSATSIQQTQARQNALVGLRIGLGELQRYAAAENRITAMAGMTGIAPGNRLRPWCGVWDASGHFLTWFSSGANNSPVPSVQTGLTTVRLLDGASVGAANSANREQVDVGRVPINGLATMPAGAVLPLGGYAYWVGDEGVKVSAYPSPAFTATVVLDPTAFFPASKPPIASNLEKVLLFEQLKFVPASVLTATELQANYHELTVTHSRLQSVGAGMMRVDGLVNINTTTNNTWAAIGRAYNLYKFGLSATLADPDQLGDRMRDQAAGAASGNKIANGPFLTTAGLADSGLLISVLGGTGITAAEFLTAVEPVLTTRSDTFRLRAYGDAVNRADANTIESRAFCEAIVQRQFIAGELKFTIIAFRWLAADDV